MEEPDLVSPDVLSHLLDDESSSESIVGLVAPLETSEHFKEVYRHIRLCFQLARQLTSYLGFGWKWMIATVRLVVYTIILLPGFLAMIVFYFLSQRVIRNIPYGREARNVLDLYIPYRRWFVDGNVPVVVFVTGGAWMIGYKAWGALLGRRLSQQGVIVACLDYRNFPQGRAPDMVADVTRGIGWVLNHIHSVGGDRQRVYLVGQSCGGHLALMALFQQVLEVRSLSKMLSVRNGSSRSSPISFSKLSTDAEQSPIDGRSVNGSETKSRRPSDHLAIEGLGKSRQLWDPAKIKGFVALSSPFDIEALADHFNGRGLSSSMFRSIMSEEGDAKGMAAMNPLQRIQQAHSSLIARLPPILCLHGTEDATVPYEESLKLQAALKAHGVDAACKLYPGCTHTSPLLENPMAGGRDDLMEDILGMVKPQAKAYLETYSLLLFPHLTTRLARWVCPF